jgi:uncharacterized protein (TIGR03437 family)
MIYQSLFFGTQRAAPDPVVRNTFLCLALWTASVFAAPSGFLLGLNSSEWAPNAGQIAADNSGALYILWQCTLSGSCVTKLSADGTTVVWQNSLGVSAQSMAVDPAGDVYLILAPTTSSPNVIEKLSTGGTSVVWSMPFGTPLASSADASLIGCPGCLAVDSTGRAFILRGGVTRLTAAGAIDATFPFPSTLGQIAAVAVDPTGSNILVATSSYPSNTFARLISGAWVTLNPPLGALGSAIAVAPNGDAVIYGTDANGNRSLQRIDPTGAVVFTTAVPSETAHGSSNEEAPGNLALDAAGNAYITSYTAAFGTFTRNSLATCGSAWLGVYAPDGSTLQITYLPGAASTQFTFGLIALGGSSVFVLDAADPTFAPTQSGPFPAQDPSVLVATASALFSLSPNPSAPTLPLACVANAASFDTGAVAPGELVTLFGNNLGPAQGIATTGTLQTPYPVQAAATQVTFDGTPAPLLWVQDSQINAAVPWSVAGPTTKVCVTYNNTQSNCLTWPVSQFAPGVFTLDGTHAAALNQDGTLNTASNPAPVNSIVAIWATGLGPITPAQPDGSLVGTPLPVNAYQVVFGKSLTAVFNPTPIFVDFPTTYAGPAPSLIAGTVQVNFNLADALIDGLPLTSSTPVTLAVETPSGAMITANAFEIYIANK